MAINLRSRRTLLLAIVALALGLALAFTWVSQTTPRDAAQAAEEHGNEGIQGRQIDDLDPGQKLGSDKSDLDVNLSAKPATKQSPDKHGDVICFRVVTKADNGAVFNDDRRECYPKEDVLSPDFKVPYGRVMISDPILTTDPYRCEQVDEDGMCEPPDVSTELEPIRDTKCSAKHKQSDKCSVGFEVEPLKPASRDN